jgi:hypothetical protein
VADARGAPAMTLDIDERRSTAQRIDGKSTPADIERALRWMLITGASAENRNSLEVTGSDEVAGRICAVIRGTPEEFPELTMAIDDEDGRLLRLSFADRLTGSDIRYDYSKFEKKDGFRIPRVRMIFLGDRLYATEIINKVELDG